MGIRGFKTPKKSVNFDSERILKIIKKGSNRLAKKGVNKHEMLKLFLQHECIGPSRNPLIVFCSFGD